MIEFAPPPPDNLALTHAEKAVLARWGDCFTHRQMQPDCPHCVAGWRHVPLRELVAVILDAAFADH